MSGGSSIIQSPDEQHAAHHFFAIQELFETPELARFYTDLLINSPTTIAAARDRQGFAKSTAYKYANTLAELGIAAEEDEYKNGSALWHADPVSGEWTAGTTIELGPVTIAVYGAITVNENLRLFVDRHGKEALIPAVMATLTYLEGENTRRGVADTLGVPAVEGIAVTQAIERVVTVVQPYDPTLSDVSFDVAVNSHAVETSPYQPAEK